LVSGVRKHAKGITTEAELNALPSTVLYASTTAANIALTPTGTAIAFERAGGASLTPFAPSAAKVWTDPSGTKLPRKLTKSVIVFYYNNASVTDGDTAKSQMLSLYGISPSDTQAVGTSSVGHMTVLPWMRANDSGDIAGLLPVAFSILTPATFPGLTIPGLGTISAGEVPSFTYNLSASLNKQQQNALKLYNVIMPGEGIIAQFVARENTGIVRGSFVYPGC
jgi:hypothetical protein